MTTETFQFQTEVQQLLELMIHSLYSHKDIFLRELVSNASDATDRLRFEALTKPELLTDGAVLEIALEVDKEARTLTIHDNGIGMSKKELVDNIGTIAKSGTRELAEKMKKASAADKSADIGELIGQFGVGFYSSFMVAHKVELVTRRAGQKKATRWVSEGKGDYQIDRGERETHGTSITLHLEPVDEESGLEDFTDEHVLSRIISRYSDFIAYPIVLRRSEGENETLNSMKPIWERAPADVTDEEYAEFYKHISHDWREPLERILQRAEGTIEYKALLFIPSEAPFDLYYVGHEAGLRLYVKRVSIMERCEELLPRYLRFVQGVVDSSDLPLNVSREILQHDRQIHQIRKGLQKKILDSLQKMKEGDGEKYLKFWTPFGPALKEGVIEDFEHREKIVELLLFPSSRDPEKLTSLAEYVERMGETQNVIYYMTGESRDTIESSPHLEAFRDKGVEVLFLTDAVDEMLVQALTEYQDKKLQSAGKGTVELGTDEEKEVKKKALDEKAKTFEALLERIKTALSDRVKEVRLSSRLTSSPACLVGGEEDVSPRVEKWLRQQKGEAPVQKRILELNPEHPIVTRLKAKFDVQENTEAVSDYGELLYGYSLLAEGSDIPDPAEFAKRFALLMERGLE
jgi:molecular chaperone HtpG